MSDTRSDDKAQVIRDPNGEFLLIVTNVKSGAVSRFPLCIGEVLKLQTNLEFVLDNVASEIHK